MQKIHLFNETSMTCRSSLSFQLADLLSLFIISSMLVISDEISLIETTSHTKSNFFNNGILKTLPGVALLWRAVAMSKKSYYFLIIVDEWIVISFRSWQHFLSLFPSFSEVISVEIQIFNFYWLYIFSIWKPFTGFCCTSRIGKSKSHCCFYTK